MMQLLACKRCSDERGGVAIVIGISMIAIIGMVGIAVDGGILFNERRDDQNVADHAALAAAWAFCNGRNPVTAGLASAADNGATNDGVNSVVTISQSGPMTFQAVIQSSRDSAFVGVVGVDQLESSAEATAECVLKASGGYAAFAGATACNKALDWSGSTINVTGRVHSNNDIHISGAVNIITGQTTYIDEIQAPPDKIVFVPPVGNPMQLPAPLSYPMTFNIADYQPGGVRANLAASQGRYYNAGNNKIDMGWLKSRGYWNDLTKILRPGLYYSNTDIDLSASMINGLGVTFVSNTGQVSLSGSRHILRPWDPDELLIFSNRIKSMPQSNNNNCQDHGAKLSGSQHLWEGIIYVPRVGIQMSGSDNTSFKGALIGWTVQLNGSMIFLDAAGSGPIVPAVRILD